MTTSITLFTRNIFETGIVTISGTPSTGFPESRVFDRSIDFFWKTTDQATTFLVNNGTDVPTIDFMAIEKHNFSGAEVAWGYSSSSGIGFTAASTASTQADNNQIVNTIASPSTLGQMWRFTVTNSSDPQASEVFMSLGREFDILQTPNPVLGKLDNVQWNKTVGGSERGTRFGDVRRRRQYSVFLSATQVDDFRDATSELDNFSKPFYVKDHEGDFWFARFNPPPDENPDHPTDTHISFNLLEML